MDKDKLERVVRRAREDPAFFHALVYDPRRALSAIGEIDRESESRLLSINPESLVERLITPLMKCGMTCGDDSCERTCGTRSCGVTCASSCSGSTCGGKSCGQTTFVFGEFEPMAL
jgi:hypothetical protein